MYFLKRWGERKNQPEKDQSQHSPLRNLFNLRESLLAFTLFALNFIFIWPFLGQDYPLLSFSTPVLPLLAQIITSLTHMTFAQAVGFLVLLSFPLASFTWFVFFRKISSSSLLSFLTGLIFLLPWFYLPRFNLFWYTGDGIHALGFAILPLAGILFLQFLKTGSYNLFLVSFLAVSLISLISPFAFLNLYLFLLIITFSEMLLGEARIKALRLLAVCLFAQGFSSFWYHPAFFLSLFKSQQGEAALAAFWRLFPISFFVVPVFSALAFLIFDRKTHLQPLFFALTSTVLYLALVAVEGFSAYLPFPVPTRFFPEFYVGFSFLAAIALVFLFNLPKKELSLSKIHPHLAFTHHATELFLTTLVTAFLVWPAFSLVLGLPIIPQNESFQVLGAQDVWWGVSRDGVSQYLGYAVTLLTCSTGIFLKSKIKN